MSKTIAQQFDEGKLDDSYAEYIMEHCKGDRVIANGDMLIAAMEDGYLAEDFIQSEEAKLNNSAKKIKIR